MKQTYKGKEKTHQMTPPLNFQVQLAQIWDGKYEVIHYMKNNGQYRYVTGIGYKQLNVMYISANAPTVEPKIGNKPMYMYKAPHK